MLQKRTIVRMMRLAKGVIRVQQVNRSYLPFKSAREYQDRKMKKWQGFFLSEHTSSLKVQDKAFRHVYAPGPQMDWDEIGQNLSESYESGKRVEIGLNIKENDQYKKVTGVVKGYFENLVAVDKNLINLDDIRVVELLDDRDEWKR